MTHLLFVESPPRYIWIGSLIALLIGLILFLATTLKRTPWDSTKKWSSIWGFVSNIRWKEILKDIGIGFIVAGVVSVTYEWNTRSMAEREKDLETINRLMSSIIGPNVWEEIRNETIKVPRVRRNLVINLHLQRDWTLPNGQKIDLPKCRAILFMEIGYDLYLVSSEEPQPPVQQALNYEMWDEELQLPRFERVRIITPKNPFQTEEVKIEGDVLHKVNEVYDGKGTITLQGKYAVKFPPPEMNKPVRIITERYEIVNTPGQLSLTMGALTARVPGIEPHTITVHLMDRLDDVEPRIETFWSGHRFTPNADKSEWTFDGIMLPGQGLQIVFNVPRDKKSPARRPCD